MATNVLAIYYEIRRDVQSYVAMPDYHHADMRTYFSTVLQRITSRTMNDDKNIKNISIT